MTDRIEALQFPTTDVELSECRRERLAHEALSRMDAAVSEFYRAAVAIEQHQFVEHAGLMSEYVRVLKGMHAKGECIWESPLWLKRHHAQYLGEKLNCIYGGAFARDPDLFATFCASVRGKK